MKGCSPALTGLPGPARLRERLFELPAVGRPLVAVPVQPALHVTRRCRGGATAQLCWIGVALAAG